MVKNQLNEWNQIFLSCGDEKPKCDDWLAKFENVLSLSGDRDIIDLGCGFGNDTLYLAERGYGVISCEMHRYKETKIVWELLVENHKGNGI